jgi:hypothetical protein
MQTAQALVQPPVEAVLVEAVLAVSPPGLPRPMVATPQPL